MNNKVKFLRGTSDEYAVAEKDSDTIYFTTDDGKLYIGDKEVSGSDIIIDDTLSDTSTNPVQNKVIKAAIDEKADKTVATTTADGLMSASDKSKLDDVDNTYALKSKYGNSTINVGRKEGTAVGSHSTAEGYETEASGYYSHAEGQETTANGNNSCHSEGQRTTASGIGSHAEGVSTNKVTDLITDFSWQSTTNDEIINAWNTQQFSIAHRNASHVEGLNNLSLGTSSHAEGCNTVAVGSQSHTSGYYTKALHDNEFACGTYNKSKDDTLFSIGDGTSDSDRHNAFEITTTGGKLHDKDIATTDIIPDLSPYAKTADVPNIKVNSAVNADTVNSKKVEMATYTNLSSFGVSRTDTADTIWQAIPNGSIYVDLVQNLTDTSWNFPSGVSNEYTIYITKMSKHRIGGMYLYPKTGGYIYWANVNSDGSYSGNWKKIQNEIKSVTITANTDSSGLITLPNNSTREYISVIPLSCIALPFDGSLSETRKFIVVDQNLEKQLSKSITFTAYYYDK